MIKFEKMEKKKKWEYIVSYSHWGRGRRGKQKSTRKKFLYFGGGDFLGTIFALFGQVLESYRHLVLNPSLDAHIQGNIRNLKNKKHCFQIKFEEFWKTWKL
jgi:hypothetical protein